MRLVKCSVHIETDYGPWDGGCLAGEVETAKEMQWAMDCFYHKVQKAMKAMPNDRILSCRLEFQPAIVNGKDAQEFACNATELEGVLITDLDLIFAPIMAEKGKVKRGKRA